MRQKKGLFNEIVKSLLSRSKRLGKARAAITNLRAPCRSFEGGLDASGYGKFSYTNKKLFGDIKFERSAHIVAWMIANKREPTKGKEIGHLCQNEWCVEPTHLKEVDKEEHAKHSLLNRKNADPANKTCKLTTEEVYGIRYLYDQQNYSVEELQELYSKVSKQTIYKIINRKSWRIEEFSNGKKKR
jgi:hypothetical protein